MRPEKGEVAMAKVIVRYTNGDEDEHEVMDLRVLVKTFASTGRDGMVSAASRG